MRLGTASPAGGPAGASGPSWREYRLLGRIGRGGSGEVWKAEAAGGFFVALKFVPLADRLGDRELRSLDILRTVRHPNLLVTYGAWPEDDQLVIAMELADRTLWCRYREATEVGLPGVPRDELLDALADAARAIDYLNAYPLMVGGREHFGIQHRDIKPQNLLVVGGGTKVGDLGVARMLDRSVVDHTGGWSFAYAPPEFFQNQTTRSSDQYSLAVTYCQLLTGRLPFAGSLAEVVLGQLMNPPDLEFLGPEDRAVVGRALSKEPGRRWPSCAAFVEALRRCPAGSGSIPELPVVPATSAEPSSGSLESGSSSMNFAMPAALMPGIEFDTWILPDEESESGIPEAADLEASPIGHDAAPGTPSSGGEWARWVASDGLLDSEDEVEPGDVVTPTHRRPGTRWAVLSALLIGISAWKALTYLGPWTRPLDAGRPAGGPPPLVPAESGESPVDADPPPAFGDSGALAWSPPEIRIADDAGIADRPQGEVIFEGTIAPPASEHAMEVSGATPTLSMSSAPCPPADLDGGPRPPGLLIPRPESPSDRLEEPGPGADPPAPAVAGAGVEDGPPAVDAPTGDGAGEITAAIPNAASEEGADLEPVLVGPAGDGPEAPGAVGPEAASALNESGLAHFLAGRSGEAVADFNAALEADPRHADALRNRGAVHWHEGRYAAALADFDAAIGIDPDDAAAFNNRGLVHRSMGDPERAVADYNEAIRLEPGSAVLYYNRAQAHALSGRDEAAIGDLSQAIRLDPEYAKAYRARGEASARRGDHGAAESDLARAQQLEVASRTDFGRR